MKATLVREPPQVSAGNMRNKLQPGAARPGGLGGPGQGVGHLHPTACTAPVLTSQCSWCCSPWDVGLTSPPGLPSSAQPQAASIPGVTLIGSRRKNHLEKKGKILYLSISEVRSGTTSSVSRQSLQDGNQQMGHDGEHGSLGVLQEVECTGLFKGTPLGDWSPSMSVQGHMIPDSDGRSSESIYHLQCFHIHYPLAAPQLACGGNGQASLQLNLSKVKPCILCVLRAHPPN